MFGIIRRDPETVLIPPTTTRIPGRIIRTGTEGLRLLGLLLTVRAQSVRSPCAVTQSRRSHFPDQYLIRNGVTNKSSLLNSDPFALLHTDLISSMFRGDLPQLYILTGIGLQAPIARSIFSPLK